jgi:predicted nucleotidyltransferase
MKPSKNLIAKRDQVQAAVERYKTTNLRIFGSVSHGLDQEDSDIDFLVDALPGATLFDLGGLQEELQTILGTKVDLLTPLDLPSKFRDKVISEAKPV